MPWLCSALRSPHRAWAGDVQQRGSGALPLARLVVTSLWELGTGAMGAAVWPKPVTADMMIMVRMVSSWSHPLPHSGLHTLMT